MSWFKVDDRLPSSRKLLRIPRARRTAAVGLWTLAGAWSSGDLTDGWIPQYAIEELCGTAEAAADLVTAGLWEAETRDGEDGFVFHKWAEYQPTKDQVEGEREAARERKRRQRRNDRGEFAGQDGVTQVSRRDTSGVTRDTPVSHAMSQPGHTVPGPSRPVPSPPDPTPSETAEAAPRADVDRVCDLLADLIAENASNGQRPTITKGWRDAARLLIDKDGRSVQQIEWISRWVQAHEFWAPNVRSMPKLREKFEQLVQTAKRDAQRGDGRQRVSIQSQADALRFYEESA